MKWIGLAGKMGAGKDFTFVRMLDLVSRELPMTKHLTRVSFADQLRRELDDFLEPGDLDLFWRKPYSPEIRKLLQWWGTELRRSEDPNYWVKKAEQEAMSMGTDQFGITRVPVFTDVRFPNEADMIREHEGLVVRLYTTDQIRKRRAGTLPDHESETALDDYDFDMYIDSSADDAKYQDGVERVLERAGLL